MAEKELTIYCQCAYYDLTPEGVKSSVLKALRANVDGLIEVSDLCRLSANKDPRLKEWASAGRIRIFACYERAIRCLFSFGGAPLPDSGVEYYNLRTDDIGDLVAAAGGSVDSADDVALPEKDGEWVPWFPVIDYDRCTNCKQCMNFCLFGVYGVDENDRVVVRAPANCKTNCPACARVCPKAAIVFAKHPESPINGDKVDEQALAAHKEKARLEILLKGNIRERLRNRGPGKKRFSTEATEPHVNYLEQLKKDLSIPDEVLTSLSSDEVSAIRARSRSGGHAED